MFVRVLGAGIVLLALLAITGWLTGHIALASFNRSFIPMAPLTAVLFLLNGTILFGYGKVPRAWLITVVVISCLVALIILIFRLNSAQYVFEYLGLTRGGVLESIPLGIMSWVTALSFLLASLAIGTIAARTVRSSIRYTVAYTLAILLLAVTFVFILGYLYGQPILYGSKDVPPAVTTLLAFGLLGTGIILILRAKRVESMPEEVRAFSYPLITIFVFLMIGIISVGGMYFRNYEQQYRHELAKSLESIANLKVEHLVYWRNERISDGIVLHNNRLFAKTVYDYIQTPANKRSNHPLHGWLKTYSTYGEISVAIVDPTGRTILSQYPGGTPVSPHVTEHIGTVLTKDSVVIHDFYRYPDGKVYLAIIVPIIYKSGPPKPIAALVLRVDPHYFLFPFIQQWPTESATGETLIVRRDGKDVLFLNDLRFHDNSALNFRFPLADKYLPAAMAVRGKTGVVEGVDYRGIEVFACVKKIKDSPWFLVARLDKAEVFKELRERMVLLVGLVLFLTLGTGSWLIMSVRKQRLQYYETKYTAAEALRESEFRLRQAESVGHLGHWQYNVSTSALTWSDEMYKIHGVDRSTFNPSPNRVLLLIHPEDRDTYRQAIASIQENGEDIFEYRIPLDDGTTKYVRVKGLASMDRNNELEMIYGVTLDTTDIKGKERKLEEINSELARFTYTVSHDLKSPLVTVKTFLGYLDEDERKDDAEKIATDMRYIHAAIDKMSRLLDELLELSRVGRILQPPQIVSCDEIIDEALSMVAGQISEGGIEIQRDGTNTTLYGDRTRLVEIWQNLIDNAAKYMGDTPHPSIEIGTTDGQESPVFYVRDTGMGIDPRYKDKVFGLFEKLDNNSKGTGLGLALVQRIVKLYNGKIWLESDGPGQGTTFYFTLPSAIYTKEGHA